MNIEDGDIVEVEHTGGLWILARVDHVENRGAIHVSYVDEDLTPTGMISTTYPEFCRPAPPHLRIANAVAWRIRVRLTPPILGGHTRRR